MPSLRTCLALSVLTTVGLADGCHRSVIDHAGLTAATHDSLALLATRSANRSLPPHQWPAGIMALRPERIIVRDRVVEIVAQSYFDGGWGYYVTTDPKDLPMPRECVDRIGPDIYWHGPC